MIKADIKNKKEEKNILLYIEITNISKIILFY
jgi:hypothetical protein